MASLNHRQNGITTGESMTAAPKAERPSSQLEILSLRAFFRVLAAVGTLGIALLTWIHRAASPDAIDPLWQRFVVGAACFVLFAASWRAPKRSLTKIAYVIYGLLTLWVLELLVLNHFAQDYALAAFVVTAGIAATFRNRWHLLGYQVLMLAGTAVAALAVPDPRVSLLIYFSYSVVLAILVFVAVTARIDLDARRTVSEERFALVSEQLVHEATHDPLTGLPNRTLLLDRLERLLTTAKRHAVARFAVLVLDLDRFKRVNDSLGHAAGDLILCDVAQRLRVVLRDEDTLARVGSDEFVVVVPRVGDEDAVLRVAQRLTSVFETPVSANGQAVHLGVSIGITVGPNGYTDASEMLRDADIAMHRSKKTRTGRPELFDEAMQRYAIEQLRLEAELREALHSSQLELHYQPIISFATGKVEAFEALLRWQHPEHGLMLPDRFLALAEETGLIVDIGRWALREACQAQRRWGSDALPVHVNLSAAHFSAGTIVEDVDRALAECSHSPRLGVEITESVLLSDPDAAAAVLDQLKVRGVGVAIDDFGTGYSSLRYLHSLPADVLKIDRTFVSRSREPSGMSLIRSMVLLAQQLGLTTVAEGIETEEQARLLRSAGATHAQGFLYSKAVPEHETAAAVARI